MTYSTCPYCNRGIYEMTTFVIPTVWHDSITNYMACDNDECDLAFYQDVFGNICKRTEDTAKLRSYISGGI